MDALAILHYGNQTVLRAVDKLPHENWEVSGVCGVWSVKDIIAHLLSFELMLLDVMQAQLNPQSPTPTLDEYTQLGGQGFNDSQVPRLNRKPPREVLAHYEAVFQQVLVCTRDIPAERLRTAGTIPWYGDEYALDDLIVYAFYGHKREHCAQIDVYRDTLR